MNSRRVVLRRYPSGVPQPEDFEVQSQAIEPPKADQVLVETHFLSMDPAPRMRMSAITSGPPPLPLGATVIGRGVGVVLQSAHSLFKPGDVVAGELGWQEHALVAAAQLRPVERRLGAMQWSLGILGPSGITAWCLVNRAAEIRAADTVLITAAAGSVGSTAVQLAKSLGARTIAQVGGERQRHFAQVELGADAVVDYRSPSFAADLALAAPSGIDVFLDSIGGELHNQAMPLLAPHARVVAFGFISAYNMSGTAAEYGRMYELIRKRASLRGFLVGDYAAEFPRILELLSQLLASGELRNFESCARGLEAVPSSFVRLFSGDPIGKQLVQLR
jgi:NADPH-dependent curcumin reductase CurA